MICNDFKEKTILLSGANGFLAGFFINEELLNTKDNLILLCSTKEKIENIISKLSSEYSSRVKGLTNQDFFKANGEIYKIDYAVHMAFARRNRPAADIADSIVFSKKFYEKCSDMNAAHIINISSQGVYGNIREFRTEKMPAEPVTAYSMAKYASEVLADTILGKNRNCNYSNMRIDYIVQSQNLIRSLCKDAITKGTLHLIGGQQTFSFIDVRDAAGAIATLIKYEGDWKKIYNIGWNEVRYTLIEIADKIADQAKKYSDKSVTIILKEQDTESWAGMNTVRFTEDTGWTPKRNIDDMITDAMQEAWHEYNK